MRIQSKKTYFRRVGRPFPASRLREGPDCANLVLMKAKCRSKCCDTISIEPKKEHVRTPSIKGKYKAYIGGIMPSRLPGRRKRPCDYIAGCGLYAVVKPKDPCRLHRVYRHITKPKVPESSQGSFAISRVIPPRAFRVQVFGWLDASQRTN